MLSVIQERNLTEHQREQIELQKYAPQKLNPEIEFELNARLYEPQQIRCSYITPEESLRLINESGSSIAEKTNKLPTIDYPVYTREEVQRLLLEDNKWGSTNMTESEPKTRSTTKHTKPTKRLKK